MQQYIQDVIEPNTLYTFDMYHIVNLTISYIRYCYNPRTYPNSANTSIIAHPGFTRISYTHSNKDPMPANSVVVALGVFGR